MRDHSGEEGGGGGLKSGTGSLHCFYFIDPNPLKITFNSTNESARAKDRMQCNWDSLRGAERDGTKDIILRYGVTMVYVHVVF
jgi:hypothetical protein